MSRCKKQEQCGKMEFFVRVLIASLFIYNDNLSISIANTQTLQYLISHASLYAIQKGFFIYNCKDLKWWQLLMEFLEIGSLTINLGDKKLRWVMIGYYLRIFLSLYCQLFMIIAQELYKNLSQSSQIMVLISIVLGSIGMTTLQSMKFRLVSSFVIRWLFQMGLLGLVVMFLSYQNQSTVVIYFIFKLIFTLSVNYISFKQEYPQIMQQMKFSLFALNFYICIDHGPFYEFRWRTTKSYIKKAIKSYQLQKQRLSRKQIPQNNEMNNFTQHENQLIPQVHQNNRENSAAHGLNLVQHRKDINIPPINNPPGILLVDEQIHHQEIIIEGVARINQQRASDENFKDEQNYGIVSNEVMLYSLSVFRFNTFLQVMDGLLLFLIDLMTQSDQQREGSVVVSNYSDEDINVRNKKLVLSHLRFMSQIIVAIQIISFIFNHLLFMFSEKYFQHSVFCAKKIELKRIHQFIENNSKLVYLSANVAEIDVRSLSSDPFTTDQLQELVSSTLTAANKRLPLMKIKDINNSPLIQIEGFTCQLDQILHDFLIVTLRTVPVLPNFTFVYPEEQELLPSQIRQLTQALNYRTLTYGLDSIQIKTNGIIIEADTNIQMQQLYIISFYKNIATVLEFQPNQILYDLYDI